MIVGIDPGSKGGLTALGTDGSIMFVFDLERGLKWLIECCTVGNLVPSHVFVEEAHAMPKQGVTSMFTYGCGYGRILGVLLALRLPWEPVKANEWKKALACIVGGKDKKAKKERSFQAAGRLFPRQEWAKSKDGLYESALIAEYGRRKLGIPAQRLAAAKKNLDETLHSNTRLEAAEEL